MSASSNVARNAAPSWLLHARLLRIDGGTKFSLAESLTFLVGNFFAAIESRVYALIAQNTLMDLAGFRSQEKPASSPGDAGL
ncbi:hypothetical protein HU765_02585 [Pseudomonas sp. SWRI81]|uniref:hypothetical protein n=1 Tax=Pseudomonas sp. SWRI81 TaxID=2745505 RepID=UPI001643FED9|nr:hypothetical protein [Pseudomonas sp. SWRI81]MBC3268799.1 hypothetical protein [Pseudomonas sp. SWRI81]